MIDLTALMSELCALWDAEYHEVTVGFDGPFYGAPATWCVTLDGRFDGSHKIDDPHGADWVTLTWSFYDGDLSIALGEALGFAQALAALAPPEET